MGQVHDLIADSIAEHLIANKTFGNRYLATSVPIFPKPDFVLLSRSKLPEFDIAFEVKPPHAEKREYLTGLGQTIAYLQYYPASYLIIPNEEIDGYFLPEFLSESINNLGAQSLGLISYDIQEYEPRIVKEAEPQKTVQKEVSKKHSRPWLFWMDTSIEEVGKILRLVAQFPEENLETKKSRIWKQVLRDRYSGSKKPDSYLLNYSLFFSSLELWDGNGNLTVIGNRLKEISTKYGENSIEFKNALHYLILTTGGYLRLLKFIQKTQDSFEFDKKGDRDKLIKEIKKLRQEQSCTKYEDLDLVVETFEKNGNEWLRVLACQALKEGYGRDLSQVLDDISRRFSPYFHKYLDTGFLNNHTFVRRKGYSINWGRIINLIQNGEENLRVF
ncbi:MAG: hypothetical protein ACTSP3_00475 [Candidatus Heimdallarchaeaceae archaeon]